jgi:hypothetical protein
MWFAPEQATFVDGRVEVYPVDFLLRVAEADHLGRYQELFREYRIRCAVTRTGTVMTGALKADPEMTMRYGDERWSVFVREPFRYR